MSKWYGSIDNRIEENRNLECEKVVGGVLTEFSWSDRHPYEITRVENQKHIWIRELGHKKADNINYSNNWELFQDTSKPEIELVYRNNSWKFVHRYTQESIKRLPLIEKKLYDKIMRDGSAVKYTKANITFGYADYYYDYEF